MSLCLPMSLTCATLHISKNALSFLLIHITLGHYKGGIYCFNVTFKLI